MVPVPITRIVDPSRIVPVTVPSEFMAVIVKMYLPRLGNSSRNLTHGFVVAISVMVPLNLQTLDHPRGAGFAH